MCIVCQCIVKGSLYESDFFLIIVLPVSPVLLMYKYVAMFDNNKPLRSIIVHIEYVYIID